MIYVKLVAVCGTAGCETTQEYLVEVSAFETEEGLCLNVLPDDWVWAYPFSGARMALCPHCVKERMK